MIFSPIHYDEPLFRPPAEAFSAIIQATLGCSHNGCTFCHMYRSKGFRARPADSVIKDIHTLALHFPDARKVFIGDGNAMVLSASKLMPILDAINDHFPKLRRISAYALPADLAAKSTDELQALKAKKLCLLYTGIETGDDELLQKVHKGETAESTVAGLRKAREAGMKISAMILAGLGGKKYSRQHALNSARVVNAIQPEYLSTLVLSFPFGEERYRQDFGKTYQSMGIKGLLEENHHFIEALELEQCIFRSDHASNYLVLKGVLDRDKNTLMEQLRSAIESPGHEGLREEWTRGL